MTAYRRGFFKGVCLKERAKMRRALVLLAIVAGVQSAHAQITVPEGFAVDQLAPRLDNATPRLTAITNPAYGSGVITASASNGIATIRRVSLGNAEILTVLPGNDVDWVGSVRFDTTGVFGNTLHVGIAHFPQTRLFVILPDGGVDLKWALGSQQDNLAYAFAFTDGAGGYMPGAYLQDGWMGGRRICLATHEQFVRGDRPLAGHPPPWAQ